VPEPDPFREISEQHDANAADHEQRLRAKSLMACMAFLAGFFVLAVIAAFLLNRQNIVDALTFGGLTTGYFFVLSLGFKFTAAAMVEGFHSFVKAMLLSIAFGLCTLPLVGLTILLDAVGVILGVFVFFYLMVHVSIRLYETTPMRGFLISFCGVWVGGFFLMLIAQTLAQLLGR
jgi:hypothetical protein